MKELIKNIRVLNFKTRKIDPTKTNIKGKVLRRGKKRIYFL